MRETRRIEPSPSARPRSRGRLAMLGLAVLVGGCGTGFSGAGGGFGGFGVRPLPIPEAEADGYTIRRLRGQPDNAVALQADNSVQWPTTREDTRPSIFETEEERQQRLERERRPQRPARGASTERRETPRQPAEIPTAPAPRALAPTPPDPELRGQAIPFAPPGTVTTGGSPAARTGTFGGPAGSGTTVRDGGTTTLMGADGTLRTVPTPR